jgi:cell division septation protein DedD
VQVAALRQRGEADAVARRLTRKGYDAYVIEPSGRANRVYRVRVGRFASRGEADQLKDRLAREEQFKPWVTQ